MSSAKVHNVVISDEANRFTYKNLNVKKALFRF